MDLAPVHVRATPVEIRDNGWRVYEGTAGFGDLIQPYPDLKPPTDEFRPADEALSDATLASAEGVPVTSDHPHPTRTPSGLLIPETAKDHTEGAVLRAWREDDKFRVRLIVYTSQLQSEIESGAVDLSLGYTQDFDSTPGEFQGRRYDGVQRNIRINHLALVPKGGSARAIKEGMHARLDRSAENTNAVKDGAYSHLAGPPMKIRTDAALSPEALAVIASMGDADKKILNDLMSAADKDSEEKDAEETAEKVEDEAQDAEAIAAKVDPLEERIAAIEAALKDAPMKKTPRADTAPLLDVEKVLKDIEARAFARFDSANTFVQAVRLDGHTAVTVDDAAKVMINTITENLPDLAPMAIEAAKAQRLDSLTTIYQSAEKVRRDRNVQGQVDAVLGRDVVHTPEPFVLPSLPKLPV
jgi:hypothetical protein